MRDHASIFNQVATELYGSNTYGADKLDAQVFDLGGLVTLNSLSLISYGFGNPQGSPFLVAATSAIAATPIPAALPLFASAIAGLGFAGWRRKRAASAA